MDFIMTMCYLTYVVSLFPKVDRVLPSRQPLPDDRSLLDLRLVFSAANPSKPFIDVDIHANWVPSILLTGHKVAGLRRGRKVVHLQLELVAVRVKVVHAGADSVVDGPVRENATRLLLLVAGRQVCQTVQRKRDMVDSRRSLPVFDVSMSRIVYDHEAVVLVIVGDKGCLFVAENGAAAEKVQVPLYHLLKLVWGGAKAEVAHAGRADKLGLGGGHGGREARQARSAMKPAREIRNSTLMVFWCSGVMHCGFMTRSHPHSVGSRREAAELRI